MLSHPNLNQKNNHSRQPNKNRAVYAEQVKPLLDLLVGEAVELYWLGSRALATLPYQPARQCWVASMDVRLANWSTDKQKIMAGAKDFIERMDFDGFLPESEAELSDAISRVMSYEFVEVTVAEHDGDIVGGIGMSYIPSLWNPKAVMAEELFWWASKEAPKTTSLRMLRFIKARASSVGAAFLSFKKLTSSPNGVSRVYERMGLRELETTFIGGL